MGSEAHCPRRNSGTIYFTTTLTLLIIFSNATLTSTLASCDADQSIGITDRTQNSETVLAGTLVRFDGESTFLFKVFQVLRGGAELYKKKIKIRVSDAMKAAPGSRIRSRVAPPTPPSTRAYPVAMTTPMPLSPRCLSGALLGERYIVFLKRLATGRRTFELLYDGVLQTKKAIKAVKIAIEADITTTRATTTIRVISTLLSSQTTNDEGLTTNVVQQSTSADDNVSGTNTDYLPKTSDAHFEECPEYYDAYCQHGGVCHWVTGINQVSCECVNDYRGPRCQYKSLLVTEEDRLFGDYWEVFIIGTIFGIVILLTLIGAIVYVVRKRKAQARRQIRQEEADAYIQSNFHPSEDVEGQQQPDDNQNKTTDRYMRLPTNEPLHLVETATDSDALPTTTFGNSHPPSSRGNSFRLQDPPFRKGSCHSTTSASKESTV